MLQFLFYKIIIVLIKILPFLENIEMIIRASSSANICCSISGEPLKPYNGYHIYITVANSTKNNVNNLVEYFKRNSFKLGYGLIVKNGTGIVDRYCFDTCVHTSERLWFETPAELSISQTRLKEDSQYWDGNVLNLDLVNYDHLMDYRHTSLHKYS